MTVAVRQIQWKYGKAPRRSASFLWKLLVRHCQHVVAGDAAGHFSFVASPIYTVDYLLSVIGLFTGHHFSSTIRGR